MARVVLTLKEDKKKPKFEDIDVSDLISEEDVVEPTIVDKTPSKREKLEKKRKIEDYLDEHFPLNVFSILPIADGSNRRALSDIGRFHRRHSV